MRQGCWNCQWHYLAFSGQNMSFTIILVLRNEIVNLRCFCRSPMLPNKTLPNAGLMLIYYLRSCPSRLNAGRRWPNIMSIFGQFSLLGYRARILDTIYRRLRIDRDGHLDEMAISTNLKPTLYRSLYENTGPELEHHIPCWWSHTGSQWSEQDTSSWSELQCTAWSSWPEWTLPAWTPCSDCSTCRRSRLLRLCWSPSGPWSCSARYPWRVSVKVPRIKGFVEQVFWRCWGTDWWRCRKHWMYE